MKNLEPISFEEEEATQFVYDGAINIGDNSYKLLANGLMFANKCNNGDIALAGTLSGYLNDIQTDDNWCNLAIYYSPNTGACLINATIGVLNDSSMPISISFGEQTPVFKEAVTKIFKNKFEKDNSVQNNFEENSVSYASLISSGLGAPAPDAPVLKDAASSCNSSIFTSV